MVLAAVAATGALGARIEHGSPQIPLPRSDSKLLGQRIMVAIPGTSAPQSLITAVHAGEVGGVILFGRNLVTRTQTLRLLETLQRAAKTGGNPPLLVSTDQEGGQVKRLPGPPTLSPPQMAAGSIGTARSQGVATGRLLRHWDINMDLAPVADVPTTHRAFIWRQGRAFSFSAGAVASYAGAFAAGLQAGGAAATAKHFPGLGSAITDTDFQRQELRPTASQMAGALLPYRRMIAAGLDAVMLTVAGYPRLDATGAPAALSRAIVQGILRRQLGYRGVTITDSLGAPTGHSERVAGVLAAEAGADILLFPDAAPGELAALRSALHSGHLRRGEADAAYRRILALKHRLGLD